MFIVNVILKFFASGSYAIIYIYANELFPTQIRNTGIGICSMIARLGAIVGTLSNDFLVNHMTFFFFISYEISWFRHEYGYIFQLLSLVLRLLLQLHLLQFVRKHLINHYLKQSMMLNEWVLLCKFLFLR